MRLTRLHVVAAAIVMIGLAPILVGAAEVAWGSQPASRIDDIVLEDGSFSAFPHGVPLGLFRSVDGMASCRLERWLEWTIGDRTPLVWIYERRLRSTMGEMRSIVTACESYSIDHDEYPRAQSIRELRPLLVPTYVEAIETHDAWERPFSFESGGSSCRIASSGSDGCWEQPGLFHDPIGGFDWPTNRQLLGDLIRSWLPTRQRTQRTMDDMRTIVTGCEAYSIDHHGYPRAHSVEELVTLLVPTYVDALPALDAWGRSYTFECDGRAYRVASSGADLHWEGPGVPHRPTGYSEDAAMRRLLDDLLWRLHSP